MRELDNLLQRALILVSGPVIRPEHIQFELANEAPLPGAAMAPAAAHDATYSLAGSLVQAERDLILDALRNHQSRREAAERLGISPRTLRYKLARLREAGVDVPAA